MLQLTREQVLAHRRTTSGLDARLPAAAASVVHAATAGLKDSMPRAAVLSLHARVADVGPRAWAEPPLVQVWGPCYCAYAVAEDDVAVFTLGRLPVDAKGRERAVGMADRLADAIGDRELDYRDAARPLGVHPNALRYAAPAGRFLIRWDGTRRPLLRAVPAPDVDPADARLDLARRYLHVLGPGTADGFGRWAGVRPGAARATFEALGDELTALRTPVGDAWALAADEDGLRAAVPGAGSDPLTARLLPSGDTYTLLQGTDRELLVPDPGLRDRLWTPRVWPGAILLGSEVAGTWRRSQHEVVIDTWRALSEAERGVVEREAAALPLALARPITVTWAGATA